MLYISRRIGRDKFGVFDTDDGKEDIVNFLELQDAVLVSGLKIEGVSVNQRIGIRGYGQPYIYRVDVYQDANSSSMALTKLAVLTGVSIKMFGNEIVGITWKSHLPSPVAIRLSDYGGSCGNYILQDTSYSDYSDDCHLTLVLDDKIKITNKTFKVRKFWPVFIDLREVSDDSVAECVYSAFLTSYAMTWLSLSKLITDRLERLNYWKAVTVLNYGVQVPSSYKHISDIVGEYSVEVQEKIVKAYRREFIHLSCAKLEINTSSYNFFESEIRQLFKDFKVKVEKLTFEELRTSYMRVFRLARATLKCNSKVVTRFENYIQYFDVTPELQSAFASFVNRVYDMLKQTLDIS